MKTPAEKATESKLIKRNLKILLAIIAAMVISIIIAEIMYPDPMTFSDPPQTLEDKILKEQDAYKAKHRANYQKLYGE
jgi:hypothetical protein